MSDSNLTALLLVFILVTMSVSFFAGRMSAPDYRRYVELYEQYISTSKTTDETLRKFTAVVNQVCKEPTQ